MGSGGSPVDGDAGTDAADGGFEGRIDPEIRSVLERIPRMASATWTWPGANDAPSPRRRAADSRSRSGSRPRTSGSPACPVSRRSWCGSTAVSVRWTRRPLHPCCCGSTGAATCWARPRRTTRCSRRWCRAPGVSAWRSTGVGRPHVVAGGASSGGGLAAGLALLVRDRGEVQLAGQVLVYPMLDDRESIASRLRVDHPRLWSNASNRIGWASYLGALSGDDVPAYAAPSRASDMARLPPTWIGTGELDLFRDEDIEYAARLMAAGVPTELHVYPRAVHGFDLFAPHTAVSRRFCRDRDDALDRFLTPQNARP